MLCLRRRTERNSGTSFVVVEHDRGVPYEAACGSRSPEAVHLSPTHSHKRQLSPLGNTGSPLPSPNRGGCASLIPCETLFACVIFFPLSAIQIPASMTPSIFLLGARLFSASGASSSLLHSCSSYFSARSLTPPSSLLYDICQFPA